MAIKWRWAASTVGATAMALFAVGCRESAMDICHKLEASGVATKCRVTAVPSDTPLADATESVAFDMMGGEGRVYLFPSEEVFTAVIEARLRARQLAQKPNEFSEQGYVKSRCIVLLSESATAQDERATRIALGQSP